MLITVRELNSYVMALEAAGLPETAKTIRDTMLELVKSKKPGIELDPITDAETIDVIKRADHRHKMLKLGDRK